MTILKLKLYSSQQNYKWHGPQKRAIKDRLITNKRTHPLSHSLSHIFIAFRLFQTSLHVELIPKAGPTECKQRQQTPPYRKAVYQVLRAKFLTYQENKRRATRNCTVAQGSKETDSNLSFFLQPR